MNGIDYKIVGVTILILLAGLLGLLFISLAIRRAVITLTFGFRGPNKNVSFARLSLLYIIAGLLFGAAFWLGGGPHGSHVSSLLGNYFEAVVAVILIFIGVILTAAIKLPRPDNHESLSTKIVHHAYVAWPWRHKWIFPIATIIVLISGILIYQNLALRQNREAFQQARAAIDTVYADIVSKVGPPDDHVKASSCSRSHKEFGEGPLTCSADIIFVYGVEGQSASSTLAHRIQAILDHSPSNLVPLNTVPLELTLPTKSPGNTSITDYYKAKQGVNCTARYEFDTSFGDNLKLKDPTQKRFASDIECSGQAQRSYYQYVN